MNHHEILESCRKNYQIAIGEYRNHREHKHPHWELGHKEFSQSLNDDNAWRNFRQNNISAGLDDGNLVRANELVRSKRYKQLVQNIQYILQHVDNSLLYLLNDVSVGNPTLLDIAGYKTNDSSVALLYFSHKINQVIQTRSREINIVEIGGGYGGLARLLKILHPTSKLLLFDLPESNFISEYYLRRCFPDEQFFTIKDLKGDGTIENADFVILPGWHISKLSAESIDLVVNTRSMMEMDSAIVDYYLGELNRVTRTGGFFFCVNRYKKYKSSWGKISSYNFHKTGFGLKWKVIECIDFWKQRKICELMLRKTARNQFVPPNFRIFVRLLAKYHFRIIRFLFTTWMP